LKALLWAVVLAALIAALAAVLIGRNGCRRKRSTIRRPCPVMQAGRCRAESRARVARRCGDVAITADDLLARAVNEVDAGGRRALLERAEQIMIADQPLIPLYFYVAKHLVSARVQGWRDNAMNVVYSKQLAKVRGESP
jgi:hypothetical protein